MLVQTFLRHTLTDLGKGLLWRLIVKNIAFGTIISLLQPSPVHVHVLLRMSKGEQSRAQSLKVQQKGMKGTGDTTNADLSPLCAVSELKLLCSMFNCTGFYLQSATGT